MLLAKNNICIAVKERLVKDSGVAGEAAYNGIVHKLNSKPKAKGVIIFGSDQEVSGVMRAVRRNNLTANFNWIGSDGWAGRLLVSEGNEPEVEGTLAFLPQAHPVRGFDNYFLSLTPQNNKRNPWFIGQFGIFLYFLFSLIIEWGVYIPQRRERAIICSVFIELYCFFYIYLSLFSYCWSITVPPKGI